MTEFSLSGQAVVVRNPNNVTLEMRTVGAPAPREVLIEPQFVGLCGTDLEIVRGDLDPAYTRYPLVLGHEWSGTVAKVGEQVSGLTAGDAVVVEGVVPCSLCRTCRAGHTNLCENYDELGFTIDGAAAPGVKAPAHLVHRLAADIPLEAGALVEPSAVALRALTEIDISPGSTVLVIGDGTVALLVAQLVRMWSPSVVAMAGQRPEQEAMANAVGASSFTTEAPGSRSYDIVIEAAGSTSACETAIRSVRPRGQVLLLGIAGHGKAADLLVDDVVNNDLRIRGSFSYTATAWAQTVRLLNSGSFRPLQVVTHQLRIDQFQEALDLLSKPTGHPRGKVLLDMQNEQ